MAVVCVSVPECDERARRPADKRRPSQHPPLRAVLPSPVRLTGQQAQNTTRVLSPGISSKFIREAARHLSHCQDPTGSSPLIHLHTLYPERLQARVRAHARVQSSQHVKNPIQK